MSNFDLRRPAYQPANNFAPKSSRKKRKWKWLLLLAILIAGGVWGSNHLLGKTNKIFTNKGNIFSRVGSLILSPDRHLIGEDEGQVNILLMGVGGAGHDGAYLTDTMIVAELNTKTNEVVLVSIPRDFALDLPKVGFNRINAAYAYGYRDDPDTAGDAAIAAAEKVTGLTIPYFAVIDFKGFVKAVDDVGGLDIKIDRTFTDATFPNDYPEDTKGYLSSVTFTAGSEHMNGRRALIFARSRHSSNSLEASDFARSERQKKILLALKDKIFSLKLTSLSTMNNLLSDFTDNFRTNLELHELKRVMNLAQKIESKGVYSFSLEPQENLICSELVDANTGKRIVPTPTPSPTATPKIPPSATPPGTTTEEPTVVRMYVIVPCAGKTLTNIHEFVQSAPLLAKLRKEGATLEIQNSTGKTSALNPWQKLANFGLTLKFPAFKGRTAYEQTILYDNSQNGKPSTLNYLKNNYTFTISDVTYPSSSADFVIVLGQDSL